MFVEAIQAILQHACTPAQVRAIERGEACDPLWNAIEAAGFLELLTPEDQGGAGLTLREVFPVMATLGAHAVPVPIAQSIAARALLRPHGIAVPSGRISLSGRLQRLPEGGWTCARVPFGLVADYVISAADDDALVLLPVQGAQRLNTEVEGSLLATLVWSELPQAPRIERHGRDVTTMGAAVHAALLSGAMTRVLEMTLQYANDRVQFGRSIGKFQAIQHQLSQMAEHVAAANVAAELAFGRTTGIPSVHAAAIAKSRNSEAAGLVAAIAHGVHGAMGITQEYDLQLFTRRLHEWRMSDGSEDHWNREIGTWLLHQSDLTMADFALSIGT